MLNKDIYTVVEISNLLQVSESSIYHLIKSKKLAAIKINTIYRITSADLVKYFDENKTKN
jgi:excisionase family DNA binding protein